MARPLRIYSWNVNGLRAAARKGFLDWLRASRADVVGVQETRAHPEQLPGELLRPARWYTDFHSAERKGYSGVGLYMRRRPDAVQHGVGRRRFDSEGRVQCARFGALRVVNAYFPHGAGTNRDNSRIPFKLAFYRRLFNVLRPDFEAGAPILVMGDFNTCHEDIDLARPRQNRETSGFRPEERRELGRWLRGGYVDTFRHFEPGAEGRYTWWSQRRGVREKNIGWRIDAVLASPGALPYLRAARIHDQVFGSDHCPISVEMDRKVLDHPE